MFVTLTLSFLQDSIVIDNTVAKLPVDSTTHLNLPNNGHASPAFGEFTYNNVIVIDLDCDLDQFVVGLFL